MENNKTYSGALESNRTFSAHILTTPVAANNDYEGEKLKIDLPSGGQLFVNPKDPRGKVLFDSEGNFNPSSVKLWNLVLGLRSWPIVIDVGANYGEMLVWANFSDSAKIFAFEPNPQVVPLLKKTLSTLPFQVGLKEMVVSDSARSSVSFIIDKEWSGTSKLLKSSLEILDETRYKRISVPCTSIDTEFEGKLQSGFAMKVDVEGNEMAVLKGASQSMKEASEWVVMIEILHMNFRDIYKLARQYNLYLYQPELNVLLRVPTLNFLKLRRMLRNPQIYRQDAQGSKVRRQKYGTPSDTTINFKISIMLIVCCSLIQGRF